jgi:hypothetical protein
MGAQPHPATLSLPITLSHRVRQHNGEVDTETHTTELGVRDWRAHVVALQGRVKERFGDPVCLYTLERLGVGESTRREHVIPQATGTRWIELPPGLTSDAINNWMSHDEMELQRRGMLGALMPFYANAARVVEFKQGDTKVVLRNDPTKGFKIETHGLEPLDLPSTSVGGAFEIPIWVDEASPQSVSRALHKIAYLTLCVVHPELALSGALNIARSYIRNSDEQPYRPYAERFLPGALPGFSLGFGFEGSETKAGHFRAESILAAVKIHHVQYMFALVGGLQLPEGPNVVAYRDPIVPRRARRMLSWGYDSAERVDS